MGEYNTFLKAGLGMVITGLTSKLQFCAFLYKKAPVY